MRVKGSFRKSTGDGLVGTLVCDSLERVWGRRRSYPDLKTHIEGPLGMIWCNRKMPDSTRYSFYGPYPFTTKYRWENSYQASKSLCIIRASYLLITYLILEISLAMSSFHNKGCHWLLKLGYYSLNRITSDAASSVLNTFLIKSQHVFRILQ